MPNGNPCSLILRHSDISTTTTLQTVDNAVGSWSNYKQTTSWYVNLKNLLGNDWDKYDKFCIRLNQFSTATVAYATSTTLDVNWVSYMSGLNWVNSSYNQSANANQSRAPLFVAVVANSTNQTIVYNPNTCTNFFRKSEPNVKITIEHYRCSDGTIIQSTTGLPQTVYHFDVFGVE